MRSLRTLAIAAAMGADTGGMPVIQDPMDGDMGVYRQMMEKRMQLKQSMTQMMVDRMTPASGLS